MKRLDPVRGLSPAKCGGRRGLFPLQVGACLLGTMLTAFALEPGQFRFEHDQGTCTLEASEAPLTDVLAKVMEETGIPIQYDKDDPTTTTQSLRDVDLERLMRALAENVVMTFVVDDASPQGYRMVRVEFSAAADEATRARAKQVAARAPAPAPTRAATRTVPVKYSGVGGQMTYTPDRQGLQFKPITDQAPISRAGIAPEDIVLAIDDKPVNAFKSLVELSQAIRGKEGTSVQMTVRKPSGAVVRTRVVRANLVYEATVPRRK